MRSFFVSKKIYEIVLDSQKKKILCVRFLKNIFYEFVRHLFCSSSGLREADPNTSVRVGICKLSRHARVLPHLLNTFPRSKQYCGNRPRAEGDLDAMTLNRVIRHAAGADAIISPSSVPVMDLAAFSTRVARTCAIIGRSPGYICATSPTSTASWSSSSLPLTSPATPATAPSPPGIGLCRPGPALQ